MILSNILLGILVLFFCVQLVAAIRESMKKKPKIRLISKKTGQVFELDAAQMSSMLQEEILSDFTVMAKTIFQHVAEGFSKGRLIDIKKYLDEKVLQVFQEKISERETHHQKAEFTFIGFKNIQLIEDMPTKKVVSFTTEQVNLLRDENDKIIEGDSLYVATVTENWTFTQKKEQTWVVSGIESKEAHFA